MGVIMRNGISYGGSGVPSPTEDGDYGIVQSSSLLPSSLGPNDRKMYFVINDDCFYLWNGTEWEQKEVDAEELTTAQVNNLINIL